MASKIRASKAALTLLSVAALSGCAHLVTQSSRHAPFSVGCARQAIASIRGLTVEPGYDAIYFKGRGFSGWFHHGIDATFTQHSLDVEYSSGSKARATKVAADISDKVEQTCAPQPGASDDQRAVVLDR